LRARRVRGLAYRQIGRFADSIADLEPVLAANEDDIEVGARWLPASPTPGRRSPTAMWITPG
jgi:hypothetical protein